MTIEIHDYSDSSKVITEAGIKKKGFYIHHFDPDSFKTCLKIHILSFVHFIMHKYRKLGYLGEQDTSGVCFQNSQENKVGNEDKPFAVQ